MEKLFMLAGIVTAIVLCIIGILKLPFANFKEKNPKLFKAIFTIVSIVLSVGLCILGELYILCGEVLSLDCLILTITVIAGVFAGYSGVYEGLGLKDLVKKLTENVKKARELTENKKAIEYLNKIEDIDNAIKILEKRKNNVEVVETIENISEV